MNNVKLYEEYRLIERNEVNINRAWKGAHLLLFFLTFVFGSFCTFCFHMLMYLFDEKCVLFPKLLSLTSMRHNVIYEFMPHKAETDLPVDFVSTQWVEKSICSLPTYVPLVSGIFGLVWTTMFLMCSTGTRTLTGLQRPWRVLPPVFLFSLAMGILCIYSSVITHTGLQELCLKLGEITGSTTCTYTVNVVTLAYERRIRGVYQATRLTIISAWLHTACWLCSAVLTVVRVVLAVDFQLVRVSVNLYADVDKLMERHETQLRTISPDNGIKMKDKYATTKENATLSNTEKTELLRKTSNTMNADSDFAILATEKMAMLEAYRKLPKDEQFIVDIVYDLVHEIDNSKENLILSRNKRLKKSPDRLRLSETIFETEKFAKQILNDVLDKMDDELIEVRVNTNNRQLGPSESYVFDVDDIKPMGKRDMVDKDKIRKSNLKNAGSQTDFKERKHTRVLISAINSSESETDPEDREQPSTSKKSKPDKESNRPREK